ncbi:MAG: M14 family metallopeptidase [Cognatishimia sp.]
MWIDANFDGGNIDVISGEHASDIQLKIRSDAKSDHAQWFYFRVLGAKGQTCKFKIVNAGQASYPEAWENGSIVFSKDQSFWQRRPTSFSENTLSFEIQCETDALYIALSPPYLTCQHNQLVARSLQSSNCKLKYVVRSVQGRPVEVLQIGNPKGPKIWIIARQHPGEPMAEWYVEGFLDALIDATDGASRLLTAQYCIMVVPNVNPDGSNAGNLRTNAAGVDLNRAWESPCETRSPEIAGLLSLMNETGVGLFLDIHGDEELAFVFAAGCEGIPAFSREMAAADQRFREIYRAINCDFSIENGYAPDAPGTGDLSIACNQVAQRFGCLSLTIELPFKDNAKRPDPVEGWSATRSKSLGASLVPTLAQYFDI